MQCNGNILSRQYVQQFSVDLFLFHFSFPAFSSHPLISPVHWFCRVIPAIVGLPWNLQMYFKKF